MKEFLDNCGLPETPEGRVWAKKLMSVSTILGYQDMAYSQTVKSAISVEEAIFVLIRARFQQIGKWQEPSHYEYRCQTCRGKRTIIGQKDFDGVQYPIARECERCLGTGTAKDASYNDRVPIGGSADIATAMARRIAVTENLDWIRLALALIGG